MTETINITGNDRGAAPLHKAALFFYGDEGNPFLAPRGVHTACGKLIVADTAQNRIFIWNSLPDSAYCAPDVVLGQQLATDTGRNSGGAVSGATLQYPSGIWSDGRRLVVADAWNHRVLVWNEFPDRNGQPADVVIGQPDMYSNEPNRAGVGAAATGRNLYWPYGVWSDGVRLWIADTGNRRVLFYIAIPVENGMAADGVIGQSSLEEKDFDAQGPVWPYSVKLSPAGELAITDTQYYRVLLWHRWEDAFTKPPDVVIGQPDMEACGQNQYLLRPAAGTLNWCYDCCFGKEAMYVADTGNSRILGFKRSPLANNPLATDLWGNLSFKAIGEHLEVGLADSQRIYWPFAVTATESQLIVADTGNHRIVFYDL